MELSLDLKKRYTYADYLTWLDDKRRELIDGFVHLISPHPRVIHQEVNGNIFWELKRIIKEKKGHCKVYQEIDVVFPEGDMDASKATTVLQPDICVICDLSKLQDTKCIGAPDLIVEVLSPSTLKYDWNYKFNQYEKAGVREYWIADPKAKTISVFLLQADGKYDDGTVYESHQKAPVFIFEGSEIGLNELFEE